MIRMILLGTMFIGVTVLLLVFQPGADSLRREPVVSRAQTELETLAAPASATSRTAADLATLVRASEGSAASNEVAASAEQAQPAPPAAPSPMLTAAPSARLESQSAADSASLEVMTRQVLSNINRSGNPPKSGKAALQSLVAQSMRQEESDAYLDALLNEARDSGKIEIPGALITADNRVDTATLLASLVQHSAVTGQGTATSRPVNTITEPQSYTVQPGDSLASISYRFYGETYRYTAIYEANRNTLVAPDKIKVGQKLTIPVP